MMMPGAIVRKIGDPEPGAMPGWRPPNLRSGARAELRALVSWSSAIGLMTILSLLGYVWVRIQVVEAGYRLSVTRQLVERLDVEGRELEVRAAAADAPGRLEELASARLGMRRPFGDEEGPLP